MKIWIDEQAALAICPESVSARQIRLWLVSKGISLQQIDNAIAGIADERLRDTTRVEWEYAPYCLRTHDMINAIGAALGLTPAQIDNAFREASQL